MCRGEADGPQGQAGAPALQRAAGRPDLRLRRPGRPGPPVGFVSLVSRAAGRLSSFRKPWHLGVPARPGERPRRAPAPCLEDRDPLPGCLPALGALSLPSSGPGRAGQGRLGAGPGAAPRGAAEAVGTLGRLPRRPRSPGGAPRPGGLRRGASGRACGLAQSRGCCSLRARGQARLARPQLGGGARGVDPGLGGGSRHGDARGAVGAAGGVHVGHPIQGRQGRQRGRPSCGEREETVRHCSQHQSARTGVAGSGGPRARRLGKSLPCSEAP